MKKIIQIISLTILGSILILIIIFVFNPANFRTKIIGYIVNSYVKNTMEKNKVNAEPIKKSVETPIVNTKPSTTTTRPLLNAEQEKNLQKYGIDTTQLPSKITPAMQSCFYEKLGEARAQEIVNGAEPGAMDILKAKDCIGL